MIPVRIKAVLHMAVLAVVTILAGWFILDRWLDTAGWKVEEGALGIDAAGPRYTELLPTDFACHVYGRTRFIHSGIKAEDKTQIRLGPIDFQIGHGDTLIAYLGVVGEFELCVDAADQRVWHDGETLYVQVDRLRFNRPALRFGLPDNQDVPSCSDVASGKAVMPTDPSLFEQTRYLCTGGFTLDQGETAEFYQAMQSSAEQAVTDSRCLDESMDKVLEAVDDSYRRLASALQLEFDGADTQNLSVDRPDAVPMSLPGTEFGVVNDAEFCG